MYWDDIGTLLTYASERYSDPSVRWKEKKFKKRCYEINTCNNIINICMDAPFKDPVDILEEYLIYLEGCILCFKHRPQRKEEYMYMKNVVISLLNKLY